jgi:integrase/recombinase XerD
MDSSMRFLDDVQAFLDHLRHERGMSPHTLAAYDYNLAALGRLLADGVMSDYLRPHFADLDKVLAQFGEGHAPATVGQFIASLRTFYRWLALTERLPAEAIETIEDLSYPKVARKTLPALTVEQVRTLLQSVSPRQRTGARDKAILEVLYSSGCRARELCGLLLADLDGHKGTIKCVGKGGSERLLYLGEDARTALHAYVCFERPFFTRKSGDSPFLFLGQRGKALQYVSVLKIVQKRAKAAGLPEWVRPHTLRRSCALHLLNGSNNVRAVQEFLGHRSLNSTQRYVALDEVRLQEVHAACHPHGAAAADKPVEVVVEALPDDWCYSD